MKQNRMKSKLLAGEPAFGCSIMIPSPQMVEMVAHAGFDWVLIDLEHGTIDLETAELMIMASEASGITPIARPRSNVTLNVNHCAFAQHTKRPLVLRRSSFVPVVQRRWRKERLLILR